jgi:hypothetical protein
VFGGGFGFAAEDEASPLAAFVRGVVDLLPEGDEIVGRRDDRDDSHPIDGRNRNEMNTDDETSVEVGEPEPVVPTVGEDGGDDGDDLNDGLQLADLAGFDGEALGGGDRAQTGDEKLAADDEDGDPGLDDAGVVADEDDVGSGDKEFVGQWVEEYPHRGDLMAAAGEVAVETIGDAGQNEDDGGDDLLLTVVAGPLPGEDGGEYPDEQRHAGDTAHRYGVRQVHGPFCMAAIGVAGRSTDTSILPY